MTNGPRKRDISASRLLKSAAKTVREFPSWTLGQGRRIRLREARPPDPRPRILRDVEEVRRLMSHVYGFPYPILDRDRVHESLGQILKSIESQEASKALEELEDLRWYLLGHLIIAEAAGADEDAGIQKAAPDTGAPRSPNALERIAADAAS